MAYLGVHDRGAAGRLPKAGTALEPVHSVMKTRGHTV
jgi:hypothetical protein